MKKKNSKTQPLIYIIAGEHSGDNIGAQVMKALRTLTDNNIQFAGVGGPAMLANGFISLFPIQELAVMGLTEIIPKLPRLIKRIRETVQHVEKVEPDVVVTIDSPDFCFRVAKCLKGKGIPLIHCVAPSVWAWRPKRAKKISKVFNHLLAILPFEPPYFNSVGLNTTFIGHPIIESPAMGSHSISFRKENKILTSVKIIAVLPGSRDGEICRHMKIFRETLIDLKKKIENIYPVIIINKDALSTTSKMLIDWPIPYTVIHDPKIKYNALASADIALAASGTIALELACVGTPSIITYRINWFSAWVIRRLVKVRFANIINLILNREAVPEYIQERCNSKALSTGLFNLINSPLLLAQQKSDYLFALNKLKSDTERIPSVYAAKIILRVLNDSSSQKLIG